ncbi:putative P3 protein [Hypsibius exemplaris]|uniref:P3 protein n=1 Tax=Hypsibius exemplaris TaxID=2072580 RepID=A0A1W0WAW0_HYPEX|nr:putative P3 protein [Hypsibius exemplaris]
MHCVCVVGTLLLMLIPYVVSQASSGLRSRRSASNSRMMNCTFYPLPEQGLEKIHEAATGNVTFNCTCSAAAISAGKVILLQITPEKPDIVDVVEGDQTELDCGSEGAVSGRVVVLAKFLGRDSLFITATDRSASSQDKENKEMIVSYPVSVMRLPTSLDTAFIVIIAILVGINTINMGCHLDLAVVKENLQKPCAIGIGFTSQYIFMPLIAYGVALALLPDATLQLGLFTMGCSPGGGASNFWTLLLEGDAHLSITMTFLSTALALAMMPFWLFTLGGTLFGNMEIRIPFTRILGSLISLIAPLAIGCLIRHYRPTWAAFSRRLIRPFTLLMMLFIFTFGIYTNLFMFYVMTWRTMLAGLIVPWCGYVFGATLAVISKRGKEQVIAIAVETGVQNTGIAIVLLRLSLPQPDADLASVVPVCGSIMLFIPLFLWYCGLVVRNRLVGKSGAESVSTTEDGSLDKFGEEAGLKDDEEGTPHPYLVHGHAHNGEGTMFNGLGGKQFSVPSSQQELLKGAA